jgi:hypothetical protein
VVGDWSLDCTLNISSEHKVMTIWMQYISFNHFDADNSVLQNKKQTQNECGHKVVSISHNLYQTVTFILNGSD